MADLEKAYRIAEVADVTTPENSVVLYSISYQPTDKNKKQAYQYMNEHPESMMLDDTDCGKQLIALGLETGPDNPPEELMKIWRIASKRFIMSASGNVTAFVENADRRSTFVSVELPLILQNDKIKLINGKDKFEFSKQFNGD
ncbi:MAG: hypothetical protein J6N49_01500 [Alphaproteobacteria bacterium]|nr:hypothetical protein [Alphaproteobacteria bacterium]